MAQTRVQLIPWDAQSEEHIDRLVEQRVNCGWYSERVASSWRDLHSKGVKCIYWLVLDDEDSRREERLKAHTTRYPKESTPIRDTSTFIGGSSRTPTGQSILPVGHISLDTENPDAAKLELGLPSEGCFWIKALYVSYAIQNGGLGRAAMDVVENMATGPPLNARTLVLDTVQGEDSQREDYATAMYGGVPKMTNEAWYSRRGYQVIKTVQGFYGVADKTGYVWDIRTVFMRRDLV